MTHILKVSLSLFLFLFITSMSVNAQTTLHEGTWSKKKYSIKGSYKIVKYKNGDRYLILSKDFKTKSGPDLKIYFTSKSLPETNGKNASKNAYELVELKSVKSGQKFKIPDSINLSKYKTVLIHCEAYSVLWGGASL